MSKDLMLILGAAIPEEIIIDQLSEALTQHKITPSKDSKERLEMYCMLLLSKTATEKHGLEKIMKETSEVQKIHERLNDQKLG